MSPPIRIVEFTKLYADNSGIKFIAEHDQPFFIGDIIIATLATFNVTFQVNADWKCPPWLSSKTYKFIYIAHFGKRSYQFEFAAREHDDLENMFYWTSLYVTIVQNQL